MEEIWKWYQQSGRHIIQQLRRLGASLDWSREVFTMDKPRSTAVSEAFVRLHDQGVIYRGVRMINWCPHLRTVLSDIEVEYVSLDGPTKLSIPGRDEPVEFGVMHHFAYPLADRTRASAKSNVTEIVVGTTRLETMLGDVAVCVHPDDSRYSALIGGSVVHPIHGVEIPIIGDADTADPELGTGAVKITPAHDPNDLACAQRHTLKIVSWDQIFVQSFHHSQLFDSCRRQFCTMMGLSMLTVHDCART